MTNRKRLLITTSDERTWKFDRPVLFLGEWCRLYDRREIWGSMDASVLHPFGLDRTEKIRDHEYLEKLNNQLLCELVEKLNQCHNEKHTVRYWNIVLGHWLRRYTNTLFNRFSTLKSACENYNISETITRSYKTYSLVVPDSMTYLHAAYSAEWDQILCAKLLKYMNIDGLHLKEIDGPQYSFSMAKGHQSPRLRSLCAKWLTQAFASFSRPTDAFIISSCLPRWKEILLQASLGQFPQLWRTPSLLPQPAIDGGMREKLRIDCSNYEWGTFEHCARAQLQEIIPICFVEGYSLQVRQSLELPWPKFPRFIFTSNHFDTDEVFKIYAATRSEEKKPYMVGQHGNAYGTHICNESVPEVTCADKFYTWGWVDSRPNIVPAFSLNKIVGRKIKNDKNGGLLLVEGNYPPRTEFWDTSVYYSRYQEEQFRFVGHLPASIQKALTVRLFLTVGDVDWKPQERWRERIPQVRIQTRNVPMINALRKSRLTVHSYDSTSLLEALSVNIPTMCFWQGGFEHLVESAKPYYELLKGANIFADTPEQVAKNVASYWEDIDAWWLSEKVQNARREFCHQFARAEKNQISTLKKILNNNSL